MTEHDSPDVAGLEAAEERLQAAVAANDADLLALSLHDDLLAIAPDGSFATKAEDLAGYASGAFRVTSYRQLRRRSLVRSGAGVTAVRAHIRGSAGGEEFEVVMDYTRTWLHEDGRWQVLAAHLSLAPASEATGG
jgi:ketosteroid isomerase-like protein